MIIAAVCWQFSIYFGVKPLPMPVVGYVGVRKTGDLFFFEADISLKIEKIRLRF